MDFNIMSTGLYKSTPEKLGYKNPYGGDCYHCKNFTFMPKKYNDKWYMVDTYFGDWSIEVTDENFKLFEIVFDRNRVVQISRDEYYTIAPNKRFCVPVDSGGQTYAKCFKIIGAKPLRKIIKNEKIEKIKFYKSQIEYLENDLLTIDADERYEDEKTN